MKSRRPINASRACLLFRPTAKFFSQLVGMFGSAPPPLAEDVVMIHEEDADVVSGLSEGDGRKRKHRFKDAESEAHMAEQQELLKRANMTVRILEVKKNWTQTSKLSTRPQQRKRSKR
jgi:hypothetical protein